MASSSASTSSSPQPRHDTVPPGGELPPPELGPLHSLATTTGVQQQQPRLPRRKGGVALPSGLDSSNSGSNRRSGGGFSVRAVSAPLLTASPNLSPARPALTIISGDSGRKESVSPISFLGNAAGSSSGSSKLSFLPPGSSLFTTTLTTTKSCQSQSQPQTQRHHQHHYRKLPLAYRTLPSAAAAAASRGGGREVASALASSSSLHVPESSAVGNIPRCAQPQRSQSGPSAVWEEAKATKEQETEMPATRKHDSSQQRSEPTTEDWDGESQHGLLDSVLRRVKSRVNNSHDFRTSYSNHPHPPSNPLQTRGIYPPRASRQLKTHSQTSRSSYGSSSQSQEYPCSSLPVTTTSTSRARSTTLDGAQSGDSLRNMTSYRPSSTPSEVHSTYTGSSLSLQSEGMTFDVDGRRAVSGSRLLKSGWDDEEDEGGTSGRMARTWTSARRFKSKKQDSLESLSSLLSRSSAAAAGHLSGKIADKLPLHNSSGARLSPRLDRRSPTPSTPPPHPPPRPLLPPPTGTKRMEESVPPARPPRPDVPLMAILKSSAELEAEQLGPPRPPFMSSDLSPRPCRNRPVVIKSDERQPTVAAEELPSSTTRENGSEHKPPLPKRSHRRVEPLNLPRSKIDRSLGPPGSAPGKTVQTAGGDAAGSVSHRTNHFKDWSRTEEKSDAKSGQQSASASSRGSSSSIEGRKGSAFTYTASSSKAPLSTPLLQVLVDEVDDALQARPGSPAVAGLQSPIRLHNEDRGKEKKSHGEEELIDNLGGEETVKSSQGLEYSLCTTPASTASRPTTASLSPSSSLGNPLTPLGHLFDRQSTGEWNQHGRGGKNTFGASSREDKALSYLRWRGSRASAEEEDDSGNGTHDQFKHEGQKEYLRWSSQLSTSGALDEKGNSLAPMTVTNRGVHVETDPLASTMRIGLQLEASFVKVPEDSGDGDPRSVFSGVVSLSNSNVEAIGFAWLRMREARSSSLSSFAAGLDCQSIAQGQPQEIPFPFVSTMNSVAEDGNTTGLLNGDASSAHYPHTLLSSHLDYADFSSSCTDKVCSSTLSTTSSSSTFHARPLLLTSKISSTGSRSLDCLRQSGIKQFHRPLIRPCSSGNPSIVYGRGVSLAYRSPITLEHPPTPQTPTFNM